MCEIANIIVFCLFLQFQFSRYPYTFKNIHLYMSVHGKAWPICQLAYIITSGIYQCKNSRPNIYALLQQLHLAWVAPFLDAP